MLQESRKTCHLTIDDRGIATLTLARPQKHNAFSGEMVAELNALFATAACHAGIRSLVLAAEGPTFCAGADLGHMQAMADASRDKNLADAMALAEMLRALDTFPRPTLALVQGPAFGGAVGVLCCCDTVFALPRARFCLSEARLGIAASVISPYVLRALGARQARRYVLTAEVMTADVAREVGLVHEVTEDLAAAAAAWHDHVLRGAPVAQGAIKNLFRLVNGRTVDDDLVTETATLIADLRAAPEAREGLAAFFARRPPAWAPRGE